jgi:transposase-like protein
VSDRHVEELLAERGVEVDHVTIYGWVQTFTPQFINAGRPARHAAGDQWFLDQTYVRVAGCRTCLYRMVNQQGRVIDALLSRRRNAAAARSFFAPAGRLGPRSVEVVTDWSPAYPQIVDETAPAARHITEPRANNSIGPTVVGSRRDCGRWADSNACRLRAASRPGTRSTEPAPRQLRVHRRPSGP